MKNFKSLILGSAAGMLAVAGAQAADLPVKAKPVEYVKVCSAYGAGFYYIPGTDICLRVGGYLYSAFFVNDAGFSLYDNTAARNRADNWTDWRVRTNLIFDARTNTEYGVLRSYFQGGFQWDTNAGGLPGSQSSLGNIRADSETTLSGSQAGGNWRWYWGSAFIQFAGFTFGIANSFFDGDSSSLMSSAPGLVAKIPPMIAYTAQLGSGLSASISLEDSTLRRRAIQVGNAPAGTSLSMSIGAGGINTGLNNGYSGQFMPDVVANLRVDQAWGDAQVAAALHQVKTSTLAGTGAIAPDKWGYAFNGQVKFKLPQLGAGDNILLQAAWAKGAVGYNDPDGSGYSSSGRTLSYRLNGNTFPNLTLFDAYIPTTAATSAGVVNGGLELVKSYSYDLEYQHYWTPTLRSTVGYVVFNMDAGPVANAAGFPDGKLQSVNANLVWSPVKNLDLGTEVFWANLKTTAANPAGNPATSTSGSPNGSQSWYGGVFRAVRYW